MSSCWKWGGYQSERLWVFDLYWVAAWILCGTDSKRCWKPYPSLNNLVHVDMLVNCQVDEGSAVILREGCSFGIKMPNVRQEHYYNTTISLNCRHKAGWIKFCLGQILPSACGSGNWDSSDRATFLSSTLFSFWWACAHSKPRLPVPCWQDWNPVWSLSLKSIHFKVWRAECSEMLFGIVTVAFLSAWTSFRPQDCYPLAVFLFLYKLYAIVHEYPRRWAVSQPPNHSWFLFPL